MVRARPLRSFALVSGLLALPLLGWLVFRAQPDAASALKKAAFPQLQCLAADAVEPDFWCWYTGMRSTAPAKLQNPRSSAIGSAGPEDESMKSPTATLRSSAMSSITLQNRRP